MPGTFDATHLPGEIAEKPQAIHGRPVPNYLTQAPYSPTSRAYQPGAGEMPNYIGYNAPSGGGGGGGGGGSPSVDASRWGYGDTAPPTPSPYTASPSSAARASGGNGAGGGSLASDALGAAFTEVIREARGPAAGWDDRPTVYQNIQELGTRTPPMSIGALSNVARQFGKVY